MIEPATFPARGCGRADLIYTTERNPVNEFLPPSHGFDFLRRTGTACRRPAAGGPCPLANLGTPLPLPQANIAHLFRGEAFAVGTAGILPALFSRGYNSPNSISSTSSLVSSGAPRPALRTGRPVIGSTIIFALPRRFSRRQHDSSSSFGCSSSRRAEAELSPNGSG